MSKEKLLDEFFARRCDEILRKDKAYQIYNADILAAEKEFKATLTQEQMAMYNKLEELILASIAHSHIVIYKKAAKK